MADPVSFAINMATQLALQFLINALTPAQEVKGPRMDNRKVTISSYGHDIPLAYGTVVISPNIIWASDIIEVVTTIHHGKGGPKVNETRYTYFANFAAALCQNEVESVLRIYADGKLIYNAEDSGPTDEIMPDLDFTLYPGNRTQPVDPLIESYEGPNTPAFRGTAYLVFNRFPLEKFGNRIPQLRVVLAMRDPDAPPVTDGLWSTSYDLVAPDFYGNLADGHYYDPKTQIAYVVSPKLEGGVHVPYLQAVDVKTGNVLLHKKLGDIDPDLDNNHRAKVVATPGSPFLTVLDWFDNGAYNQKVVFIEKDTFRRVSATAVYPGSNVEPMGAENDYVYLSPTKGVTFVELEDAGRKTYHFLCGSHYDYWLTDRAKFGHVKVDDQGNLGLIYGTGITEQIDGCNGIFQIAHGQSRSGEHDVYLVSDWSTGADSSWETNTNEKRITRYKVTNSDVVSNPTSEVILTFPAGEVFGEDCSLYYDKETDRMLVALNANGNGGLTPTLRCYDCNSSTGTANWVLMWEKVAPPYDIAPLFVGGNEDYSSDTAWWLTSNGKAMFYYRDPLTLVPAKYFMVSIDTGEIEEEGVVDGFTAGDAVPPGTGAMYVDPRNLGIVQVDRALYMRKPAIRATIGLDKVVQDICSRSHLDVATDIDVTDLATKQVRGYFVEQLGSFRSMLEPLGTVYNFYAVEAEGKLVFKFNRGATDVVIPEDDLIEEANSPLVGEMRGQDSEVPRALYVKYLEVGTDDTPGTQVVRRTSEIARTMNSVREVSISLPLFLTPGEAMGVAERVLFESWVGREKMKFKLPPRYLNILANDVLQISIPGRQENIRVDRLGVGADLSLEIEGHIIDGEVYATGLSGISREPLGGYTGPPSETDAVTRLRAFYMDTILFDDGHLGSDRGRGVCYFTAAKAVTDPGEFHGATLQTSFDASPFATRTSIVDSVPWGICRDVPNIPHVDWNGVQAASITFDAFNRDDAWASVTHDAMVQQNQNRALLVKGNGEVEQINFQNATDNGDGSITIDTFLRGRRGSDVFGFNYDTYTGPVYILLGSDAWISGYFESPSHDGSTVRWRAIPAGAGSPELVAHDQPLQIESLMPLAPSHVKMGMSGGDRVISWTRRTRIGGQWVDETGEVPLSEDTESYEVDILDGPGGAVVRTLTSTTPSVTYTAADATADFGATVPDPLYVRVYQISAQVGRGFTLERGLTAA